MGFPGRIAAVVPLLEERDVGRRVVLVNPDHGVEAQAGHAHIDPLVSR